MTFQLFLTFFRIGLFTFGGGQAMLPLLQKEMNRFNLTQAEIEDFFALGQTLPGVIALNSAVLIGYHLGKTKLALVSALAVALPSFILVLLIASFLNPYLTLKPVQTAFSGIRLATATFIFFSAFKLLAGCLLNIEKEIRLNWLAVIIFVVTMALLRLGLNPFIAIGLNLVFGVMLYKWKH